MLYLRLFFEFAKAGLFAIGGGLATLPFLIEMSEETGWFTQAELTNMIAVSESTPGPIGVNMATYVGFTTGGFLGSVVATLGLIFPSVVVIIIISKMLIKFRDSKAVKDVFYGLRPASTGLIAAAGYGVFKISVLNIELFKESGNIINLVDIKSLIFGGVLFLAIKKFKLHPIVFIIISAAIGVLLKF